MLACIGDRCVFLIMLMVNGEGDWYEVSLGDWLAMCDV